jgi:hypothetical protein
MSSCIIFLIGRTIHIPYMEISLYTFQVLRFQVKCSTKCNTINTSQNFLTKSSSFMDEECYFVRLICGFACPNGRAV